ncbi:MAG: 50S ribosomal protein L24 [Methanobacteriota archaeon]|nr:MAG: 50S ribosomal protein L24 [Euryarchaeota archaeon]
MTKTKKPGKQRKRQWEAPMHHRRKMMRAHLAPKYLEAGKRRSFTVRKGDLVRIMRGEFKGDEGKVEEVDLTKMLVTIEKITQAKADESQTARRIHASNLMIIKPDISDRRRLKKFGRPIEEEEEIEEEEGEEETTEEDEAE